MKALLDRLLVGIGVGIIGLSAIKAVLLANGLADVVPWLAVILFFIASFGAVWIIVCLSRLGFGTWNVD